MNLCPHCNGLQMIDDKVCDSCPVTFECPRDSLNQCREKYMGKNKVCLVCNGEGWVEEEV